MIKSIAIISPGGRVEEITKPLDTTSVAHDVNPGSLLGYDVILCDTPDRAMLRALAVGKALRTPVVFRMRGDPFWGMDEWIDSRVKLWVLENVVLPNVDGCIAITDHHARMYEDRTGVPSTHVPLSIRPDRWPETRHIDPEIRAVTLTNAVYPDKIQPTIDAVTAVDSALEETGGEWRIGSWSDGYSDRLRAATAGCDNVTFCGPLDAQQSLEWANCMIHYSGMDAFPNAVMEGMASEVPVITNDYTPFRETDAPIEVTASHAELRETLHRLRDPAERHRVSDRQTQYVQRHHSRERVGLSFLDALATLVKA